MANFGPIQVPSNFSNLTDLTSVVRFLSAFSVQMASSFNGLIATKEIYGAIGSTGVILSGDGFGASFVGTGSYYLTFREPFTARPSIFVTPLESSRVGYAPGATLSGISVVFTNLSGSNANSGFNFLVKGQR